MGWMDNAVYKVDEVPKGKTQNKKPSVSPHVWYIPWVTVSEVEQQIKDRQSQIIKIKKKR